MGIEFGIKAKDKITGFVGIVTGNCQYISGCDQVLLVPECGKDGSHREGHWFDLQRIVPLGGKKIVLDNSRTPGPDKPAPIR